MRWLLAFLIVLPLAASAQQNQCRTSPVGASTAYCASEAFVTDTAAAAPQGTVTTAGPGLVLSGGGSTLGMALNSATLQASPANPTASSSPSGVMMGLGTTCKITPVFSTRIRLAIQGTLVTGAVNDFVSIQTKYSSGSPPSNGASPVGTSIGSTAVITSSPTGGAAASFNVGGIITGLTTGTAYWLDLDIAPNTSTASVQNISCSADEF